jgi:hypothetical protein
VYTSTIFYPHHSTTIIRDQSTEYRARLSSRASHQSALESSHVSHVLLLSMSTNSSQIPTDSDPTRPRAQSTNSFASSFKSPRAARFAEATTVNSPIEPPRSSFIAIPTNHFRPQAQPSDIGFGYIDDKHTSHVTVEMEDTDNNHLPRGRSEAPLSPPLKSAMKTPGVAPRNFGNLMSPTFREEHALEKRELATEKEQAKDIVGFHHVHLLPLITKLLSRKSKPVFVQQRCF